MNLLTIYLLVFTITVISGIQEFGFPLGFFQYGDKDKDGKITQEDLDKNLNMAWIMQYHALVDNAPDEMKAGGITEQEINLLIAKDRGILRVTNQNNYGRL